MLCRRRAGLFVVAWLLVGGGPSCKGAGGAPAAETGAEATVGDTGSADVTDAAQGPDATDPGGEETAPDVSPCPAGKHPLADGTCVECRDSADCPPPFICDGTSHACGDWGYCHSGFRPCSDGKCHACCADSDCPKGAGGEQCKCDGYACDLACSGAPADACKAAGLDCSQYPGFGACCFVKGGSPTCCQCATDADCATLGSTCVCNAYDSCVDKVTQASCSQG